MFDDYARGRIKTFHALPRSVGIGNVVEAELLAVQLFGRHQRTRCGVQIPVKRGLLVRVFAVAQILQFHETSIGLAREQRVAAIGLNTGQVVRNRTVVLADAVERCNRQRKFGLVSQPATGFQLIQHHRVLRRISEHAHILPVLCRRANHGRATNVDVLDRVFQRAAWFGHRRFKRIQVNHQQVDRVDTVGLESSHVFGHIPARQQAAMHLGVQCFDAAVQHFGETRQLRHFRHRQARICEQFGCTAGRDQLDAECMQCLREFEDAGFVRDGEQCIHYFQGLL